MSKVLTPFLFLLVTSVQAKEPLADALKKLTHKPPFDRAHWGMLVVDAKSGKTIYEKNADRLFAPASVTKLFSCAAALCELGADYRFKTPVLQRGKVKKGRLDGDLILVAQGDLCFGGRNDNGKILFHNHDHTYANGSTTAQLAGGDPMMGLKDLARQIKKAGIKVVEGEVLIDDRLFDRARGSGSGPDILSPIIVNDNVIDIIITPGKKVGDPASVRTIPQTSFVQMDAQVKTVEKGKGSLTLLDLAGERGFTVRGWMGIDHRPLVRIYPVRDPSRLARAYFIDALRKEGIEVEASAFREPKVDLPKPEAMKDLTRVAEHVSLPLSEMVKVILKVSHNLYASTLPLLIAAKHGKRDLRDGLRLQGKMLKKLGVDISAISFAGGAGGSNADRVTPRETVRLLQGMAKRPEWKVYRVAMPVLGVDGTLVDAVPKESPARGKVSAKTGTLGWTDFLNGRLMLQSKALAGTMKTKNGKQLFFAIFVNGAPLPKGMSTSRVGKLMGRICELIHHN